jgi:anti-anti-sigma factor
MKVEITDEGPVTILSIVGRMDATTAHYFDEGVKNLLVPGRERLLIDLSRLDFISSAGLRSLLTLAKDCQKNGLKLAFCALNSMVGEVFRISGFTSIFTIHPDRATALGAW